MTSDYTNNLITNTIKKDMKESILKSKSFALAVRIVRLYKYLSEQKTEYSESKADFAHKMGIARK